MGGFYFLPYKKGRKRKDKNFFHFKNNPKGMIKSERKCYVFKRRWANSIENVFWKECYFLSSKFWSLGCRKLKATFVTNKILFTRPYSEHQLQPINSEKSSTLWTSLLSEMWLGPLSWVRCDFCDWILEKMAWKVTLQRRVKGSCSEMCLVFWSFRMCSEYSMPFFHKKFWAIR